MVDLSLDNLYSLCMKLVHVKSCLSTISSLGSICTNNPTLKIKRIFEQQNLELPVLGKKVLKCQPEGRPKAQGKKNLRNPCHDKIKYPSIT